VDSIIKKIMTHFYVISAIGYALAPDRPVPDRDEADRTRLYRIIHGLVAVDGRGHSEKQRSPESS
jgi:hypothetical protein